MTTAPSASVTDFDDVNEFVQLTSTDLAGLSNAQLANLLMYVGNNNTSADNSVDILSLASWVGNNTLFSASVPSSGVGFDNQVAFITSGNLNGAIYQKQSGTWTFMTNYIEAPRTSSPPTAGLPTNFRWRLYNQLTSSLNGIYSWNGASIVQISAEGPTESQYTHTQSVAALVWNVNHNLNGQVDSVNIYVGGQQVSANVSLVDNNNLTISFAIAQTGTAVVEL